MVQCCKFVVNAVSMAQFYLIFDDLIDFGCWLSKSYVEPRTLTLLIFLWITVTFWTWDCRENVHVNALDYRHLSQSRFLLIYIFTLLLIKSIYFPIYLAHYKKPVIFVTTIKCNGYWFQCTCYVARLASVNSPGTTFQLQQCSRNALFEIYFSHNHIVVQFLLKLYTDYIMREQGVKVGHCRSKQATTVEQLKIQVNTVHTACHRFTQLRCSSEVNKKTYMKYKTAVDKLRQNRLLSWQYIGG